MFLVSPKIPFLPKNSDTQKLLAFGDPLHLKDGVTLKDKETETEKTIYSLYDLDLNVKYLTDQGHSIRRISDHQIVVKKKAPPQPPSAQAVPVTSQSTPINIPSSLKSNGTTGSYLRKLSRCSLESDHFEPESYDRFFGSSPLSPSFDDFDFIPRSKKKEEEPASPSSFKIVVEIQTPNIPGEKIESVTEDVILVKPSKSVTGKLYLTNYQLIFSPYSIKQQAETRGPDTPFFMEHDKPPVVEETDKNDVIMLPFTTIAKFDKVDRQNATFMFGGENSYSIDIFSKDIRRTIRFTFDPNKHSRFELCNVLNKNVFPLKITDVFAVSSFKAPRDKGWDMYDVYAEYQRMGLAEAEKSGWVFSHLNKNYGICDTYSQILVVPLGITEDDLISTAGFRSKGRIPILAWRNRITGATLCRCSQPKTGMSRSYRCKADEKLIRAIQATNRSTSKLHILDARPMANAIANMAIGGGYENITNYPDCEIEFLGIANIHGVRDSWNKLRDLCELQADDPKTTSANWLSQLENTHWLDYVSTLISGAQRIVHLIDQKRASVLIHCSDGWDRTPQVSSLAQVLLDKEYRTIKGFCILIEKEWLQFGHKFADRSGICFEDPTNHAKDVERSPVFLQFLDAIWQLMQQFPASFEFTEDLLVTIIEHLHSSRFGTFLFNSDKERKEAKLTEISASLWGYILANSQQYLNPFYQPYREPYVLNPSVDIKHYQLWQSYYLKYISEDPELTRNKYTNLGKDMKSTIQTLQRDYETLSKENEQLQLMIQQLKEAAGANGKVDIFSQSPHTNGGSGIAAKLSSNARSVPSGITNENLRIEDSSSWNII